MALIKEELNIVSVSELFRRKLNLPEYQRPYRWSMESVNTLFNDIYGAMQETEEGEYRLGSVVLYKDLENGVYDIVDGQQRITTLALILKVMAEEDDSVTASVKNLKYTPNSVQALQNNFMQVKNRVRELGQRQKRFLRYVKENCTFVCIVTDDQAEAFQFFDSQNHRGKELMPHDLLKAFHLREMKDENEEVKLNAVAKWETYREADLANLFRYHLYPLTRWYKGKNGIGYSQADIKQFKGVKKNWVYDYILYHKAANLFIEEMNRYAKDFNRKEINPFQLTQPVLSGICFFRYVTHYSNLLDEINGIIEKYTPESSKIIPENGNGNKYVKHLFQNVLLFYADKFGTEAITETVYRKLFSFCYIIRITMQAVYQQTINKYALGTHENNFDHINIFEQIHEMLLPEEISRIAIVQPTEEKLLNKYVTDGGKFEKLYQAIQEYCGWGEANGRE